MKKSVFVMETPETCCDCHFCYELNEGIEAFCYVANSDTNKTLIKEIDCKGGYCNGKPDWCPLRPLPEKIEVGDVDNIHNFNRAVGWNTCLDEVTGES